MTSSDFRPLNSLAMRMPRSAWWSAFSHDGSRLYTSGGDPHLWVWDVSLSPGHPHHDRPRSVVRSRPAPVTRTGGGRGTDGSVHVWDIATGQELLSAAGHRGTAIAVRFADGGRNLLSAGDDGTVRA